MRLLVCGPRNLTEACLPLLSTALRETIEAHLPLSPGFVLGHGAQRGGDLLWEEACFQLGQRYPWLWMPPHRYPVYPREWHELGRAAGPRRNERMLRAVCPTYWLAAHWELEPSTPGTADMVERLRAAHVPGRVVLVPEPPRRARGGRGTRPAPGATLLENPRP